MKSRYSPSRTGFAPLIVAWRLRTFLKACALGTLAELGWGERHYRLRRCCHACTKSPSKQVNTVSMMPMANSSIEPPWRLRDTPRASLRQQNCIAENEHGGDAEEGGHAAAFRFGHRITCVWNSRLFSGRSQYGHGVILAGRPTFGLAILRLYRKKITLSNSLTNYLSCGKVRYAPIRTEYGGSAKRG